MVLEGQEFQITQQMGQQQQETTNQTTETTNKNSNKQQHDKYENCEIKLTNTEISKHNSLGQILPKTTRQGKCFKIQLAKGNFAA